MFIVAQSEADLLGVLSKVADLQELRFFSAVYKDVGAEETDKEGQEKFYFISLPKRIRTGGDISLSLKQTDIIALEQLWEDGHSWGAMFDKLYYIAKDQRCVIISQSDVSFTIDAFGIWLSEFVQDGDVSEIAADVSLDEGTWTVYGHAMPANLNSLSDAFHSLSINEHDGHIQPADKIKLPTPRSRTNSITNATTIPGISYRDMLLARSAAPPPKPAVVVEKIVAAKPKWKPSFVVTKTSFLKVDKAYGPQQVEIQDDDGCWDLIDAHCIGKFQTSVVRKRAITMLPPKILEKKNQRIQEKAAS